MTDLLPANPTVSADNRVLSDHPAEAWLPALEAIRRRHGLAAGGWTRVWRAKNPVFALGDELFVKLVPPFWAEDARREILALRLVHGRLTVPTPALLAADELEGWAVLVLGRLAGATLADCWPALNAADRAAVAGQMGRLAASLRPFELTADTPLLPDWPAWLDRDRAECLAAPHIDTLPPPLRAGLAAFFAAAWPLPTPDAPRVLLHGDVSAGNLLVRRAADGWQISGLLDFGDAKAGEWTHELLSPNINLFCGDPALLGAFYAGYGLDTAQRTPQLQRQLTARALLYYGWPDLGPLLPAELPDWDAVGRALWHLA